MNIKKKLTKKIVLRLLLFVAVIGTAAIFDYFFDDDIAAFDKIEAEANNSDTQNKVYLINQTCSTGVKSIVQFVSDKKPHLKSHDKFIQKYHQRRNYQVLKAEVQTQTTPLISTYHYLAFKKYFFTDPDDDPSRA